MRENQSSKDCAGQNNNHSFKDPSAWEKWWQQSREHCCYRDRSLEETIEFWSRKAESFQKNIMSDKHKKKVIETLRWLQQEGVTLEGATVLDIGAGPGPFTFPLAETAQEIVALEPVESMVEYLRKKMNDEGYDNIHILPLPWEEVNIEKENFKEHFDLVVASMTPGIKNGETLRKALACSKKYFYLNAYAGKRENDMLNELWTRLTGTKMPPWPDHIFYIHNLLYTEGYDLILNVWEEKRVEEHPPQEAAHNLLLSLQSYITPYPGLKEEIENFVQEKATNGTLKQTIVSRVGSILIRC